MNRKLILIANNGPHDNYLPAVTLDIQNYRRYFTLPEGGAWDSLEIKIFDNNCTINSLQKLINNIPAGNYVQIVFCGHGYALDNEDTVLELNPNKEEECKVSTIGNWLCDKSALLIADSCRKVYIRKREQVFDSIEKAFSLNEDYDYSYRHICRRAFDNQLERLPAGYFATGFACSLGECAHDDDNVGGYYSTCLLDNAIEHINKEKSVQHITNAIGMFSRTHDEIIDSVNRISNVYYQEDQHPNRKLGASIPFYIVPSKL